MGAYLGLFRMRLVRGLSYRASAIAGMATQFFFGLVFIMVLQAFNAASSGGEAAAAGAAGRSLDNAQIASYIWLQQAFLSLIIVWQRDKELLSLIASGDAAYELCRPVDLYFFWFSRLVAGRLAAAFLRCLPILLIASLLPDPYRLCPPPSLASGLAFIACLALGLLLIVSITIFAYILAVITLSVSAPFLFITPLYEFAAGMIIPLPFMPESLYRLLEFLPFRLCVDLPLRMYSGAIAAADAPGLLAQQALWILILVPLGRLALKRALASAQAAGG
jgi:ABC-2 type transport system permease protein